MTDQTSNILDQVQHAIANKTPLNICGGNSKTFMGRTPSGDTLDVSGHTGIVEYQPVELVLTARAGTPLVEIEAALAENNQCLSPEPPQFGGRATIGGTLAANQSGPARPWSGSVRDMVLGTRLINGKGEYLRFGGQVMKNVAGYDVSRTVAGTMGTLGVITEVTLKVMPKPEFTATQVMEMGANEAIRTMNEFAGQPRPLTGAFWLDGKLYLRLSGTEGAVNASIAAWGGETVEEADDLWRMLREQDLGFFGGDAPLWRFSVKSTASHTMDDADWLIDWGGAQRWIKGELTREVADEIAQQCSGQASLYEGGDRSAEVFAPQSAALKRIHQNLKNAFDPQGIFNPGRLYSWM